MKANIIWTGREYYSLENCLVNYSESGAEILSTIIGHYQQVIYKVDYRITTNSNWETLALEINSRHGDTLQVLRFDKDGKGWLRNGETVSMFDGCIDVDIPLTPFTNTLPIRRLKLKENDKREIKVIYCDLLNEEIKPVTQSYRCISPTRYHYQNVPNDFEAEIEVDENGLVKDYPQLFVRTV